MKLVKGSYLLLSIGLVVSAGYGRKLFPDTTGELVSILTIDPLLSYHEQQAIAAWLEPYLLDDSSDVVGEFKNQFSTIESVSIVHFANDRKEIKVKSIVPLVRINNDKILCTNGRVVAADLFQASLTNELNQIFITHEPTMDTFPASLISFVNQLREPLYRRFSIHWITEAEVLFSDKNDSDFTIVSTSGLVPSDIQIEQCLRAHKIMKNEAKKNTAHLRVLTDMRFDKQIIAYHKNKGD